MSLGFANGFGVPDDQKERHDEGFEEVVLLIGYLRKHGVLSKISERVRFARRQLVGSVTEQSLGATILPLLIMRSHEQEVREEERRRGES